MIFSAVYIKIDFQLLHSRIENTVVGKIDFEDQCFVGPLGNALKKSIGGNLNDFYFFKKVKKKYTPQ